MTETPESNDYRTSTRPSSRPQQEVPKGVPAAAHGFRRASSLYVLVLLSAVDGTMLMLGAAGRLSDLGGALVIGLTVIAGAGSWIAARDLFAGRKLDSMDKVVLAGLGIVTVTATVGAVWLGTTLGTALTLYVMPKAAGVVMVLIGLEIVGLKLPRPAGMPMPIAAIAVAALLEVIAQWTL